LEIAHAPDDVGGRSALGGGFLGVCGARQGKNGGQNDRGWEAFHEPRLVTRKRGRKVATADRS
jgi:hypothetical protein